MKWKAKSASEAGTVLKILAKQGEPFLKKLDKGFDFNPLSTDASNDPHNDSQDEAKEAICESTAIAG